MPAVEDESAAATADGTCCRARRTRDLSVGGKDGMAPPRAKCSATWATAAQALREARATRRGAGRDKAVPVARSDAAQEEGATARSKCSPCRGDGDQGERPLGVVARERGHRDGA